MPPDFDDRKLHPQAQAEKGYLLLPCVFYGIDLSLNATIAEAARHQDAVDIEQVRGNALFDVFGVDVADVDLAVIRNPAVNKGLIEALVRILEFHVLPDEGDVDLFFRVLYGVADGLPLERSGFLAQILRSCVIFSSVPRCGSEETHSDVGVLGGNYGVLFHVAEKGYFVLEAL